MMSGLAALFTLTAALLSSCEGKALDSVPKKIQASVGGTAVLPCSIAARNDIPTLEWSRKGPPAEMAFLYRDGYEYFDMKSPVFQFRTSLFMSKLKNGNMSLRISELRLSDQGEYQCKIMEPGTKPKVVGTVELSVGAASEPRLSAVPGEGDRTVLQCESNCWFPAPTVTFLDDQGKEIPAQKPMRDQDSQRCFNIERNVTLQTDTKRVTCRVHQPQINQTRDAEINVPDKCTCPSSANWIIGVVAVVVCVISCVATCVLNKRCSSCGYKKQPVSKKSFDQDTTEDVSAERLRTLEADLREKEEIIQQLTGQLERRSTSLSRSSTADIPDLTSPPNSSPVHNSLPKSHSFSQTRDSASPVKGHHGTSSGEQTIVHLRVPESRNRRNSARISRTFTMSKSSTEGSEPLVETETVPENDD